MSYLQTFIEFQSVCLSRWSSCLLEKCARGPDLKHGFLCIQGREWQVFHDVHPFRQGFQVQADHSSSHTPISQRGFQHAIIGPLFLPNLRELRTPDNTCTRADSLLVSHHECSLQRCSPSALLSDHPEGWHIKLRGRHENGSACFTESACKAKSMQSLTRPYVNVDSSVICCQFFAQPKALLLIIIHATPVLYTGSHLDEYELVLRDC